jgi:hypothetical protein
VQPHELLKRVMIPLLGGPDQSSLTKWGCSRLARHADRFHPGYLQIA